MSEQPTVAPGDTPESAENAGVGPLLRASRQRVGEELRDVAAMLRIRYPYLEAIESGRFGDLPGQTYAVGFVRAYAEHLGLDSEEVVRRYKEEIAAGGSRHDLHFPTPMQETGIPGGAIVFVGLVVAVLAYGGWYVSTTEDGFLSDLIAPLPERLSALVSGDAPAAKPVETESAVTAEPAPQPQVNAAPAPDASAEPETPAPAAETPETTAAEPPPTPAAEPEAQPAPAATEAAPAPAPTPTPTPASEPAPATPATESAAAQPAVAPAPEPAPTPAPEPTPTPAPEATPAPQAPAAPAASETNAEAAPQAEAAPAAQAETQTETQAVSAEAMPEAAPAAAASGGAARIKVRAKSNSYIQVRDDFSNTLLVSRVLQEGEVYEVPNQPGLSLLTGNAGALEITVDGEVVPSIGDAGAVQRGVQLVPELLKSGAAAQ